MSDASDDVKQTFLDRFNREFDEANASMDRKERELDKHGYGGDPSKPRGQVVGLDHAGLTKDETSPGFPRLDRPPREAYVRVTVARDGWTFEPAIEYQDGDSFAALADRLREIVESVTWTDDQMARARVAGKLIAMYWPDRAYFVEVWQEGSEGFAQVFQPFGVPRNR